MDNSPATRLRIAYETTDVTLVDGAETCRPGSLPRTRAREFPFVIGVLAGLSGPGRSTLSPLRERAFEVITSSELGVLSRLAFRNGAGTDRRIPRGLRYLLDMASGQDDVHVLVLDVSKAELLASLKKFRGQWWEGSPLAKSVIEQRFGTYGGQPFGCLVGAYDFDHTPRDVQALEDLARIARAAHAVFLTELSPIVAQLERWQDLSHRPDLDSLFSLAEYSDWQTLRASPASNALAFALPWTLPSTAEASGTSERGTPAGGSDDGGAVNGAFVVAAALARAFNRDGSWRQLESTLADCTEALNSVGVPDDLATTLSREGVMPQSPRDASVNTMGGAPLRDVLLFGRITHAAHAMLRETSHAFTDTAHAERHVLQWLRQFVDADPGRSSESTQASLPLTHAEVSVAQREVDGGYTCELTLRSHGATADTNEDAPGPCSLERTTFTFPVHLYGVAAQVVLPYVIGVLADVTGRASKQLAPRDRPFRHVAAGALDEHMTALAPRALYQVRDLLTGGDRIDVDLTFERLGDFAPAAVARRVPATRSLLERRERLKALVTHLDGKPRAEAGLDRWLQGPQAEATAASHASDALQDGGRAALLAAFAPLTEQALATVDGALDDVAEALREAAIPQPPLAGSEFLHGLIRDLDRQLTLQVNEVIHAAPFQALERTWLGLDRLVRATDQGALVEVRILDVAKSELDQLLDHASVAGSLAARLDQEFVQFAGSPVSMLIGDYEFDHRESDVGLLRALARASAVAGCPFVSAAAATLLQMDSWREIDAPRVIAKIFGAPEYAELNAFRDSADARDIVLAMPRFLGRSPWCVPESVGQGFGFVEDVEQPAHAAWINAAYAVGEVVAASVVRHGHAGRIQGVSTGGTIPLPLTKSQKSAVCGKSGGVETGLSDKRAHELSQCGLAALVGRADGGAATFFLIPSLLTQQEFPGEEETRHAVRSARLDWCLQVTQVAQHVRCMARATMESVRDRAVLEQTLNDWLSSYVDADLRNVSVSARAERPLVVGQVSLEERDGGWLLTLGVQPFRLGGSESGQAPERLKFVLHRPDRR